MEEVETSKPVVETPKPVSTYNPMLHPYFKGKRGRKTNKERAALAQKKLLRKSSVKIISSPVLGNAEFRPTNLMMRFVELYVKTLEADGEVSPWKVMKELGSDNMNWQRWSHNPKFMKWFMSCCESYHSNIGLANVHNSIYKHAIKESPQDRKLFVERFDKGYKPQTSQSLTFVGLRPADDISGKVNEGSVRSQSEQFRKQIESKVNDISVAV